MISTNDARLLSINVYADETTNPQGDSVEKSGIVPDRQPLGA
jgi:hypothetical protein